MNITKPLKGDRCNGCGVCCLAEQCSVSVDLFGAHPVCPALEQVDGRYWCGLMREPAKHGAIVSELASFGEPVSASYYRTLIGGGIGCDSEDD